MQKIIVIVGATGTKKTQLAIELAQRFNAEIINADAFQVYRELNAGINKPTPSELASVHHHLLSYLSIYDEFDLKIYQDACTACIKHITALNKNVIICGGSNLYIDAVIKGFNLNRSAGREQIDFFNNWNYDEIYNYVYQHDPVAALKINYNNQKRIMRAAQIIHTTHQPKTTVEQEAQQLIYDCFIIETIMERSQLYARINQRVIDMLALGWVDEIKQLLKDNCDVVKTKAFAAIGYQLIAQAIINNTPVPVELIQQTTRQLAKKQLTWNRNKYQNVYQFNTQNGNLDQLVSHLSAFFKKN